MENQPLWSERVCIAGVHSGCEWEEAGSLHGTRKVSVKPVVSQARELMAVVF